MGIVLALGAIGCTTEKLGTGKHCARNSECALPLVCRLDLCRRECNSARDCGPGLTCLLDELGIGACQVVAEKSCALQSDCPSPLVCRFEQCVNTCNADVDCPAGSRCETDGDGAKACIDRSTEPCVEHAECVSSGQICALDGRCRDECVNARDCRFGSACCEMDHTCHPQGECDGDPGDGGMRDSGVRDGGGTMDARVSDGGDAGTSNPPLEVTLVGCGGDLTCGVEGERVFCWGANRDGQLGRGTLSEMEGQPAPVEIPFGESPIDIDSVFCASEMCCATRILPGGSHHVWCWGRFPDLISGIPMSLSTPWMSPYGAYSSIASRAGTMCMAYPGSFVHCWGDNTHGQLGVVGPAFQGETDTGNLLDTVRLGDGFACGEVAGALRCWGRNDEGQLDRGTTSPTETAAGPTSASGHLDVAPGRAHACALDGSGGIVCWGRGDEGQIGDGAFTDRLNDVSPAIATATSLACGGDMCCASAGGDSELYCWGTGPLGSPGMTTSGVPVPVTRPDSGEALTPVCIGRAHACAIAGTSLYCWGDNDFGQLGNGVVGGSSEVPVRSGIAPFRPMP